MSSAKWLDIFLAGIGTTEYSHLKGFGVVKKCSKKRGCEYARYVSFACDKSRKSTSKNSSKRVDCKCKLSCAVLADGSCRVISIMSKHNHDLQPSLSRFFIFHGKISTALKRSLEAHDIASQELDLRKALDFWKYK
ncbi:hypothetical protein H5410_014314 [Solanum commersonii]|uniref:Protein FAR1-RELATED SEQUENCE n=1 Tax=Solanum commersonii TaxID=4109 RepID=A0A9J5ZR03_SOLCO|nr:hypothetical protein H5410_014314 [Solanum commersonii]